MAITTEQAITYLMEKEGLSRLQAISRLSDAYQRNDPQTQRIADLSDFLGPAGIDPSGHFLGLSIFERPAQVVSHAADLISPGTGTSMRAAYEEEIAKTGSYAPWKRAALNLVGETPLFGAVGHMISPLVSRTAEALAGAPSTLIKAITAEGGTVGPEAIAETGLAKLRRAERLYHILEPAATVGLTESLETGKPQPGAFVAGGILGVTTLALGRPLRAVLGMPKVDMAVRHLARMLHSTEEEVLARMGRGTIAEFNQTLAQHGVDPIQPLDVMTKEDTEGIFGEKAFNPLGARQQFETPADIMPGVPRPEFSSLRERPVIGTPYRAAPEPDLPWGPGGPGFETPEDLLFKEQRVPLEGRKRQKAVDEAAGAILGKGVEKKAAKASVEEGTNVLKRLSDEKKFRVTYYTRKPTPTDIYGTPVGEATVSTAFEEPLSGDVLPGAPKEWQEGLKRQISEGRMGPMERTHFWTSEPIGPKPGEEPGMVYLRGASFTGDDAIQRNLEISGIKNVTVDDLKSRGYIARTKEGLKAITHEGIEYIKEKNQKLAAAGFEEVKQPIHGLGDFDIEADRHAAFYGDTSVLTLDESVALDKGKTASTTIKLAKRLGIPRSDAFKVVQNYIRETRVTAEQKAVETLSKPPVPPVQLSDDEKSKIASGYVRDAYATILSRTGDVGKGGRIEAKVAIGEYLRDLGAPVPDWIKETPIEGLREKPFEPFPKVKQGNLFDFYIRKAKKGDLTVFTEGERQAIKREDPTELGRRLGVTPQEADAIMEALSTAPRPKPTIFEPGYGLQAPGVYTDTAYRAYETALRGAGYTETGAKDVIEHSLESPGLRRALDELVDNRFDADVIDKVIDRYDRHAATMGRVPYTTPRRGYAPTEAESGSQTQVRAEYERVFGKEAADRIFAGQEVPTTLPKTAQDTMQSTVEVRERSKVSLKEAFNKTLKNEKGAVFPSGKKETGEELVKKVPPELLKPGNVQDGRYIPFGDVDPDGIFGEMERIHAAILSKAGFFDSAGKALRSVRLPSDYLSRDPEALGWYARQMASRRKIVAELAPRMVAKALKIVKENGITEPLNDKFVEAIEGLQRMADGKLVQTVPDLPANIEKAARQFREQITDRLWQIVTGIDARAPAIFKDLNLDFTDRNLRKVKLIQEGQKPKGTTTRHEIVASRTKGMLNFDDSHDLSNVESFVDGYWPHQPLDNEEATIISQIKQNQDFIDALHGQGTDTLNLMQQHLQEKLGKLADLKARLVDIRKEQIAAATRDLPKRDVIPSKMFFGPSSVARDPKAAPFDIKTDPDEVARGYIYGMLNKRYFDTVLTDARQTLPKILDPQIRDYMVDYINIQRGATGFRNDTQLRNALSAFSHLFGGGEVTQEQVRKIITNIMSFQAYSKLFVGIRFPLVNMTQTLMTVYPLVGEEIYARAVAMASRDAIHSLSGGKMVGVWRDALAKGVLGEADKFLLEAGAKPGNWMTRGMAYTPNKSEDFNRVVAFTAGKLAARDPVVLKKILPYLKTFSWEEGITPSVRTANRVGQALVDTTQFILSPEGKPLAFQGSSARRLAGQFKSFTVSYATLWKDAIKYKDKGTGTRLLGTMFLLGGLPVATGAIPGYSLIRSEILKRTGYPLPDESGLSMTLHALGFGFKSPLDVVSGIEPFNLPTGGRTADFAQYILGPTLGAPIPIMEAGAKTGYGSPETMRAALRAISPVLVSAGESYTELKQGGLKTPGGEPISMGRSTLDVLLRGLNLNRSVRSYRYEYVRDIEDAMRGQQYQAVGRLIEDARTRGIVIGPKTMASIRARLTTEKKRSGFGRIFE